MEVPTEEQGAARHTRLPSPAEEPHSQGLESGGDKLRGLCRGSRPHSALAGLHTRAAAPKARVESGNTT